MKLQRIIWSVLIMTSFTIGSVNANSVDGEMIIRIKKEFTTSISVKLANLKKMRTEISIIDLKGKPWFSEYAWRQNAYAKQLNLEALPAGTYVLVIKNKMKTHTQALVKQRDQINLFKINTDQDAGLARLTASKNTAVIASISINREQLIDVQIANLRKLTTTVQLNNLDGVLLAKEVVKNQNGFVKRFNLEGLPNGTYFFTIQHKQLQMMQIVIIENEGVELTDQQILSNEIGANLVLR